MSRISEDSPSADLEVEEAKVTAPVVTLIPTSTGMVKWLTCSDPPNETLISSSKGNWILVSVMRLMIGLWDKGVLRTAMFADDVASTSSLTSWVVASLGNSA